VSRTRRVRDAPDEKVATRSSEADRHATSIARSKALRCAMTGNADRALKKLFCGKTRERATTVRWVIAIAEWLSRVIVVDAAPRLG
jgi:hypothetical protein